jgi:hypothetical protein
MVWYGMVYGIVLGCRLDNWGFRVWFLGGWAGNFSLHHRVQNSSGAHPASYPVGTGSYFPGVKQPGHECDQSPPSSAKVKNVWAIPLLTQFLFMVSCLVKQRDNYTFTFIKHSLCRACIDFFHVYLVHCPFENTCDSSSHISSKKGYKILFIVHITLWIRMWESEMHLVFTAYHMPIWSCSEIWTTWIFSVQVVCVLWVCETTLTWNQASSIMKGSWCSVTLMWMFLKSQLQKLIFKTGSVGWRF